MARFFSAQMCQRRRADDHEAEARRGSYPFDVRPCRAQLTFKTVPRASFEDVDTFRRAWFPADVGGMEFDLV